MDFLVQKLSIFCEKSTLTKKKKYGFQEIKISHFLSIYPPTPFIFLSLFYEKLGILWDIHPHP